MTAIKNDAKQTPGPEDVWSESDLMMLREDDGLVSTHKSKKHHGINPMDCGFPGYLTKQETEVYVS